MFREFARAVRSKAPRALLCLTLAAGLAVAQEFRPSFAQEVPSVNQIIDQLKPSKPRTRGLDSGPRPIGASEGNPESPFPESLRNRTARSLTLREREDLAKLAEGKPEINLEVTFAYNSAKLTPAAVATLRNLGKALKSADLRGDTFNIEGHTDARGGYEFNLRLSDRRAEAVKQFLVAEYNIPAKDLVPVGYGKSKLKNPSDPFGAENRRVRIVNVAANVANE
jgi:outer membrane protein OmpA-like peptidoglycan-associated protein